MSDKDDSLEEAPRFWLDRAGQEFTSEETREVMERLYEFFRILSEWKRSDDEVKQRDQTSCRHE